MTHPQRFAGLILDSPFADILALIRRKGGPAIERRSLSGFSDNLDKMRTCGLPCLIIHGELDSNIPLQEAEALYEACRGQDRRILKIPRAGHNNLLGAGLDAYCRELDRFITQTTSGGG